MSFYKQFHNLTNTVNFAWSRKFLIRVNIPFSNMRKSCHKSLIFIQFISPFHTWNCRNRNFWSLNCCPQNIWKRCETFFVQILSLTKAYFEFIFYTSLINLGNQFRKIIFSLCQEILFGNHWNLVNDCP